MKHVVNAVSRYVNRSIYKNTPLDRFVWKHMETINDGIIFLNGTRAGSIVRSSIGAAIGSNIGRSIPKIVSKGVMISGGYNPNKLR